MPQYLFSHRRLLILDYPLDCYSVVVAVYCAHVIAAVAYYRVDIQ